MLTYLGQAAFILKAPAKAGTVYWSSVPTPVYWPMVVVATCAAIIASQAMISGAFSIVTQAIALNCFPRVTVRHTSYEVSPAESRRRHASRHHASRCAICCADPRALYAPGCICRSTARSTSQSSTGSS